MSLSIASRASPLDCSAWSADAPNDELARRQLADLDQPPRVEPRLLRLQGPRRLRLLLLVFSLALVLCLLPIVFVALAFFFVV